MRLSRRRLLLAAGGTVAAAALLRRPIKRLLRPSRPQSGGRFLDPEGLALDSEGGIYVADEDQGMLFRLDPGGRTLESLSRLPGLEGPLTAGDSLVALEPGRVVLIGDHRLIDLEIRPGASRLLRVLGSPGQGPGQFQDPEGICRDEDGALWVTDEDNRRIQVFGSDGTWRGSWSVSEDPEGIAVAGSRVYVTFSKACFVGCFDRSGRPLFRFGRPGSGPGEFRVPDFVALSPEGLLYVTDQKNHRIQVFSPDGRFRFAFGRRGTAPGEFDDPEDLAFDRAGRLFVADGGNGRIQILSPRGEPLNAIS
ncbi:MAG TPA: NHL repeat-containing protein [Planctomycetota bacterium]|nr:NHL repeat-containing protein [Planctomycetota bacterium]